MSVSVRRTPPTSPRPMTPPAVVKTCHSCDVRIMWGLWCDACAPDLYAELGTKQLPPKRPWWTRLPANRGLFILHRGFHSATQEAAA